MDSSATHSASSHSPETTTDEHALLHRFFHDLNNHLGVVMGNADLLLDVDTLEEKRAKRTRAIHTAASKAAALVLEMQIKLG